MKGESLRDVYLQKAISLTTKTAANAVTGVRVHPKLAVLFMCDRLCGHERCKRTGPHEFTPDSLRELLRPDNPWLCSSGGEAVIGHFMKLWKLGLGFGGAPKMLEMPELSILTRRTADRE